MRDSYLLGKDFEVLTDHKPLHGVFNKPLSEIENARLLRFREKLMHFSFTIKYAEGKTHLIADALSLAPVFDATKAEVFVNSALANQLTSDPYLHSICDAAASDLQYISIVEAIIQNKNVNDLPPSHPARQYKAFWNDLSVLDEVLLVLNLSLIHI